MNRFLLGVVVSICVLIFAAILAFIVMIGGGPSIATIPPNKTPPPAGFVAADYRDIATLADMDGVSVTLLADAGGYFEHYFLPEQQAAYFDITTESGDVVPFVAADGTIIGYINGSPLVFPLANVFVDLDGYYEVTPHSVSERRPYTMIEGQPSPDEMRRYRDESTLYRQFSPYEYGSERPEAAEQLTVHVMLHDGVWKRAVTSSGAYLEWKTATFVTLEKQSALTAPETEGFADGKYRLRRIYFDQQNYVPGRRPAMGSTTGSSVPAHWEGTGYYELVVGERVMKFAVGNDVLNVAGWGNASVQILGREGLDYVILERVNRYGRDDGMIFLVTAKSGAADPTGR